MIQFTIKKAALGKIIVEKERQLPEVYESLTEAVTEIFLPIIKKQLSGNEITIAANLIFNPPQIANQ